MSDQHCLGCGTYGPIELHHVAGRANLPELVVPVCPPCHLILTNWQYASGLELRADSPRTGLDVQRALAVGAIHLVQLIDRRSPAPLATRSGLWQLTARTASKIMDLAAPPDRAGRWLPDSYVEPHPVVAVAIDAASEAAQVREFNYLVGAVLRVLGDLPPITADLWDAALTDPRSLPERLASIDGGNHAGPSLAMLIAHHLDAAHRVMLLLLTVEDWTTVDEQDLDEARTWIDTGTSILNKIAHAVMAAAGDTA